MFDLDQMPIAEQIQFCGILVAIVVGVTSIVISVLALRQNSRMIRESSRAYVVIYGTTANFQNPIYYLVIKNFGSSGALIKTFKPNQDLSQFAYDSEYAPFSHFTDTFVAPNQSFVCAIDYHKVIELEVTSINFEIEYISNGKMYKETTSVNLDAYYDIMTPRASTKDHELRAISYALQDLVEKNL